MYELRFERESRASRARVTFISLAAVLGIRRLPEEGALIY